MEFVVVLVICVLHKSQLLVLIDLQDYLGRLRVVLADSNCISAISLSYSFEETSNAFSYSEPKFTASYLGYSPGPSSDIRVTPSARRWPLRLQWASSFRHRVYTASMSYLCLYTKVGLRSFKVFKLDSPFQYNELEI